MKKPLLIRKYSPLVMGALAGLTVYLFGTVGMVIVGAVGALIVAWTLGRLYEGRQMEKEMIRAHLELFTEEAEELLSTAPADLDELSDEERSFLERVRGDYHRAQNALRRL